VLLSAFLTGVFTHRKKSNCLVLKRRCRQSSKEKDTEANEERVLQGVSGCYCWAMTSSNETDRHRQVVIQTDRPTDCCSWGITRSNVSSERRWYITSNSTNYNCICKNKPYKYSLHTLISVLGIFIYFFVCSSLSPL